MGESVRLSSGSAWHGGAGRASQLRSGLCLLCGRMTELPLDLVVVAEIKWCDCFHDGRAGSQVKFTAHRASLPRHVLHIPPAVVNPEAMGWPGIAVSVSAGFCGSLSFKQTVTTYTNCSSSHKRIIPCSSPCKISKLWSIAGTILLQATGRCSPSSSTALCSPAPQTQRPATANRPAALRKYQVTKQLVVKSALSAGMGSNQSSFTELVPQTVLLTFSNKYPRVCVGSFGADEANRRFSILFSTISKLI